MRFRYILLLVMAGLLACKNEAPQENTSTDNPPETAASAQPPSMDRQALAEAVQQAGQMPSVPDVSVLSFSNKEWAFGFDYDKSTWEALPASQLQTLSDFTATFSKRTPAFKMVGGLALKGKTGQALQYPVVTIGIEPLEGEAPSLENIRMQSGAHFLQDPNLVDAWPAHLESAQFPRPLVDRRRQAFISTSFGGMPTGETVQVMQAIFIRSGKFIFLQLACLQEDRQKYARDFASMADGIRVQGG